MATNLLRQLGGHARRIVKRVYAYGLVKQRAQANAERHVMKSLQDQVKAHKTAQVTQAKVVKAKVRGVQRTTRSVTKGNRKQRAHQLRLLRSNPATKQQLRRRAQFYTK